MVSEEAVAPFTAGLIGYGMAGRDFHGPLLRRAGGLVTDVVTTHPERSAQAGADWPQVRIHRSLGALLDGAHPDVLVVASPTGRHVEHASAALEAGIPVVVDKPLALDRDGAARRPGRR